MMTGMQMTESTAVLLDAVVILTEMTESSAVLSDAVIILTVCDVFLKSFTEPLPK